MAAYYTCPICGSNNDHGETCDCQKQSERENTSQMRPPHTNTMSEKALVGGVRNAS